MKILLVLWSVVAVAFATNMAPFKQAVEHERVPGRYIVKLQDDVSASNFIHTSDFTNLNARIRHVYHNVLNGIAVDFPAHQIDWLRSVPGVDVIYEGGIMTAQSVPGSWGLDRVDQRTYPLDDWFESPYDGTGVDIYVLDSGIRFTHNDFEGRAHFFWDFEPDNRGADCNGHGTHCSGLAGGKNYGTAKGATLHGGRVLNCFGSGIWDDLIAALDLIAITPGMRVVSLSLGGGLYQIVDDAVARCIASGAVITIAAGNAYNDACWYTPARTPEGITVGNSVYIGYPGGETGDTRSDSSNYGTCLDIFAPGTWLDSAWHTGDDASANLSGTSMSCPLVAGAAAMQLQAGVPAKEVVDVLTATATAGALVDPGPESPNLLLYVGY